MLSILKRRPVFTWISFVHTHQISGAKKKNTGSRCSYKKSRKGISQVLKKKNWRKMQWFSEANKSCICEVAVNKGTLCSKPTTSTVTIKAKTSPVQVVKPDLVFDHNLNKTWVESHYYQWTGRRYFFTSLSWYLSVVTSWTKR